MIIKSFKVFESSNEVEKIKDTLRDIYADISDETNVYISRLGDPGDITIYEQVLSLMGKKRSLNMHLYNFYQSVIKDKIYMVIIMDPKSLTLNLNKTFKEIESRAIHENLHIIYEDLGEASRTTIFLKDKEEVLKKLQSFTSMKESSSNGIDPCISLLEDMFADISESMDVKVSKGHSYMILTVIGKIIGPEKSLELESKFGTRGLHHRCWKFLEGNMYEAETNQRLDINDINDIKNRCERYGSLRYISHSNLPKGNLILFLNNVDEVIENILSQLRENQMWEIKRFNESVSDDYISKLQDIFADVAEDTKVDVKMVRYIPTIGAACAALIGEDIYGKESWGGDKIPLSQRCGYLIQDDLYEVSIRDLKHSGIEEAIRRCEKYTDLSYVCASLGDFIFVKDKEEVIRKILSFVSDEKANESNVNADPYISELEDLFVDVSDNTKVDVCTELFLNTKEILDIMSHLGLDNLIYLMRTIPFKEYCKSLLKKHIYQIIVRYNIFDKGDMKDKSVIYDQIKNIEFRCSKYGNFEFFRLLDSGSDEWYIFIIRDRESLIRKILNESEMYNYNKI